MPSVIIKRIRTKKVADAMLKACKSAKLTGEKKGDRVVVEVEEGEFYRFREQRIKAARSGGSDESSPAEPKSPSRKRTARTGGGESGGSGTPSTD